MTTRGFGDQSYTPDRALRSRRKLAGAMQANFEIENAARVLNMVTEMFKHAGVYRSQKQLGL